MPFAEDLSQFFSEDDFAVSATITLAVNSTKIVKVIFNTPTMDVQVYDAEIVADSPYFYAATADLAQIKKSNPVAIGGVNYKIEKITHDGTGMSSVFLSK